MSYSQNTWANGDIITSTKFNNMEQGISDMTDTAENVASIIGAEFDSTATYNVGELVVYNGSLYRFVTTHSGAWDADDVQETTIAEVLANTLQSR